MSLLGSGGGGGLGGLIIRVVRRNLIEKMGFEARLESGERFLLKHLRSKLAARGSSWSKGPAQEGACLMG